jgi:hypothetical protein
MKAQLSVPPDALCAQINRQEGEGIRTGQDEMMKDEF